MQLTTLLALLASVYCASAISCYKGMDNDVEREECLEEEDMCSTTTYNFKERRGTRTCASREQCEMWQTDANEEYKVFCCNTDFCNDKYDLYSDKY